MAKQPANATRIFLNEFNFSGFLNAHDMAVTQETADVTCLSDAGPRMVVGNYGYTHKDAGFFDGADDSFDEWTFARLGDAVIYLTKAPELAAEGTIAYDSQVALNGQPRSAARGGAVILSLDSAGAGGLSRGHVLASATVTGAGNRAGINQGAKAAGPIYRVIVRLLTFSGTNITLKVQESQNDGGADPYADVAGLTSGALTAVGIVVVSTTAALEAWRRVNIAGTFTSAVILVTGGVVAGSA